MPVDPIAIIGMAGRFPMARDLDEYWQRLSDGQDCLTDLEPQELIAAGASAEEIADPNYVPVRPLLPFATDFDARFFGMNAREATVRDPQHRVMLETAHDALANAGYDGAAFDGAIGVYAGGAPNRYLDYHVRSRPDMLQLAGPVLIDVASNPDYLTTLTAFKLGLTGPAMSLATACSTSLVAVHQACQALRVGDCDMAIAGGVEVDIPYGVGYQYVDGGILSRDGRCRPYSAHASGTNFGSAVGLVVLKRLADAVADRDTIVAVVRGSAVNNDGNDKAGFSAPGARGQARCVAEAMAAAAVTPADISYVEGHGTATLLGDPVEVSALADAWRAVAGTELEPQRCLLGSVKSNIGHAGRAAGVAGLIKVALGMKHGLIPGTVHFDEPNPRLEIDRSPFRISREPAAWSVPGGPRIAAVSGFGIGGTNAHVIVEEPPQRAAAPVTMTGPQLVTVSAVTAQALRESRLRLASALRAATGDSDVAFADIVATQALSRARFPERAFVVAPDPAVAAAALEDVRDGAPGGDSAKDRRLVWAFPGQRAQQARMGLALADAFPGFGKRLGDLLLSLSDALGRDLAADLAGGSGADLSRTELAQPLLFAVEVSLAGYLDELGVEPDLLVGHSVGEFVAATVAKVISLDDAIAAIAERAAALRDAPGGAMLALAAPMERVEGLLRPGVWVAAHNGATQAVLGGRQDDIAAAAAEAARQGITSRRLKTSHAFHTPLVEPAVERFAAALAEATLRPPAVPIVSAATGRLMTDTEAVDPMFWASQLVRPVLFHDAARTIAGQPFLALEAGPGETLISLLRRAGDSARSATYPTLPGTDGQDADAAAFLAATGEVWAAGAAVRLPALWPDGFLAAGIPA